MSSIIIEHEEYSRVMNSAEFILDVLHNSTEGPVYDAGIFYLGQGIDALREHAEEHLEDAWLAENDNHEIIQYSIYRMGEVYELNLDYDKEGSDTESLGWKISKETAEQIVRYNCEHHVDVNTNECRYFNEDPILRKYAEEHGYITKRA